MNATAVIDTLLKQEGMTRYRLAKRLDVNESLLSRAYNGKSDPGFNEVSRWLKNLGYSFAIVPDESAVLENANTLDINHFGRTLSEINSASYDYLAIHRMLKQLLENQSTSPSPSTLYYFPEKITNEAWRAFYAATIAYLYKSQGKRVPKAADPIRNKTETIWCPIKKLGKSHTAFDETFLEYNVLLPEGELKWI